MNKNSGGVSDAKMAGGGWKQKLAGLLGGGAAARFLLPLLGITGVGAVAGAVTRPVDERLPVKKP